MRLAGDHTVLAVLIVGYIVTGRLGLGLAYGHPAVSLAWAPAGLALGALLVLGYRVWPALFGAAVVLYASVLGPRPIVLLMAAANTLESLTAAYLVNRYAGGRSALRNPGNSFRFAGLVLLAGASVGATIGAAGLVIAGLGAWVEYGKMWFTWSLGNISGGLLVAPAVLLGVQGWSGRLRAGRTVEGAAVFAAILTLGLIAFWGVAPQLRAYPLESLCVPVLLWSAFRLGRRPTAAAVLSLAVIALGGTLEGYGPFVMNTPTASLVMVQVFMSITAVMTLGLAALASEYRDASAQLRELVVTDPLTGLPNYRRLLDVMSAEIARSNRMNESFSVVFFDMDGLKRINDEMGHLVGSRAVCRFAETLRASCRGTDTAARYGGDEFVAVLPDTDDDGAGIVIRRVADRLEEDPDKPALSVSAGVAVYPRDGGTPTTLLSAADRALYSAKADKENVRLRGVVAIRDWTTAGSR
jgi:diguanylate cyclase (GGDEF)-like protein